MLSRIAESLYWIGRFVERAEDTARLLTVHYHQNLESKASETETGVALLEMMGVSEDVFQFDPSSGAITSLLAYSNAHPGSIVSAINGAWRNARGARETLSADFWERLNATKEHLNEKERDANTQFEFLHWIQDRTAMLSGLAESTLLHDDGYSFMMLGRNIERADMTSRMIGSPYSQLFGTAGAVTLLRCCWGYEAYVRSAHGEISPDGVAKFLLLDPMFPRSVVFALRACENAVDGVDPRSDHSHEVRRYLGQLGADLEFGKPDELIANLDVLIEDLQARIAEVHYAVTANFFTENQAIEWSA